MPEIHPLAYVDPQAELDSGVIVGPFCYVEAGAKIGAGTRLDSHATIKSGTTLGENNFVGQGAVIGGDPQDRKFAGESTYLNIGNDNVFREYVTIHRAQGEGNATVVQNNCYLMAYVHLGHNVHLENTVTIANSVQIAGHVRVEELANIGGMVGIHQFVRVGKVAMIGGFGKIVRDVPPFMLMDSLTEQVHDINAVGLRRIGVTQQARMSLHKACKLLFKSQLGLNHAMDAVRREVPSTPELEYLLAFMERLYKGKSGRGDQK